MQFVSDIVLLVLPIVIVVLVSFVVLLVMRTFERTKLLVAAASFRSWSKEEKFKRKGTLVEMYVL